MTRLLIAIAAAAALGLASLAAPQPAQARHGAIAAGIIGGLAVGALAGAAAAANGPYYYGPGPIYYAPGPCYWRHQRMWNGWRWARVRVCD